ncbi:MAG TPA: HAD-IC family P-type ATPase [Methanoregulaceae archaeon]|nr:HAD-IC family P-type ATPase [Methanoregulaceae archaeon]HPD76181.1 HAD-IC family P-type ATPase [Methanoregulaceae archaeon]
MSVAVVFDSAGTLLSTYRTAKDIRKGILLPGVETTTLTFASPERVLIVLPVHSKEIIAASPDILLSTYLLENNVGFGISCTRKVTTAEEIGDVLYADRHARIGDLAECIRNVWKVCRRESIVTLNSGAIVNMAQKGIEFAITAGGSPFPGAKEAITELHRMGVPTFIASGDRSAKLERMADHLGIPRDRVYGVATPTVKAQIVADLREEFNTVVMVGDGINDLCALQEADVSILTEQQPGDRPAELYAAADCVVKHVGDVVAIVRDLKAGR